MRRCAGYAYLGTEWSREYYCGNVAPTEAAPKSDCNMPCAGNAADICGLAHLIRGRRHTKVAYVVGFKYVFNHKIDVFERVEVLFRLALVQKGHHACVPRDIVVAYTTPAPQLSTVGVTLPHKQLPR